MNGLRYIILFLKTTTLFFICVRHCMDSFFLCLLEPQWKLSALGSDASALRLHFVFIFRPQSIRGVWCLYFFWKKPAAKVELSLGPRLSVCLR